MKMSKKLVGVGGTDLRSYHEPLTHKVSVGATPTPVNDLQANNSVVEEEKKPKKKVKK